MIQVNTGDGNYSSLSFEDLFAVCRPVLVTKFPTARLVLLSKRRLALAAANCTKSVWRSLWRAETARRLCCQVQANTKNLTGTNLYIMGA